MSGIVQKQNLVFILILQFFIAEVFSDIFQFLELAKWLTTQKVNKLSHIFQYMYLLSRMIATMLNEETKKAKLRQDISQSHA